MDELGRTTAVGSADAPGIDAAPRTASEAVLVSVSVGSVAETLDEESGSDGERGGDVAETKGDVSDRERRELGARADERERRRERDTGRQTNRQKDRSTYPVRCCLTVRCSVLLKMSLSMRVSSQYALISTWQI